MSILAISHVTHPQTNELPSIKDRRLHQVAQRSMGSFSDVMNEIYGNRTIRLLYAALDPGVDDTENVFALSAAILGGANVEVIGYIPQTGNSVVKDGAENIACMEHLMGQKKPIYLGAVAPLALQGNETAIRAYLAGTKAFGFYGTDGWPNSVPRNSLCPNLHTKIVCKPGKNRIAETIFKASPSQPITLMTSASLTTLAQGIMELQKLALAKGLPIEELTKNIAGIFMMAGCVDPTTCGPNAPFSLPDFIEGQNCTTSTDPHFDPPCKIAEANLYADVPAAKLVFNFCTENEIKIFLVALDLTQQTQLLWTPKETALLLSYPNPVAQAMGKLAIPVPPRDAPCFLPYNTTYPDHDGMLARVVTHPYLFDYGLYRFDIGDVGQLLSLPNGTKNVYVLSVPQEKQINFWETVLPEYQNFQPRALVTSSKAALLASFIALPFFNSHTKTGTIAADEEHCSQPSFTVTEIMALAAATLTVISLITLVAVKCIRSKRIIATQQLDPEKLPLNAPLNVQRYYQ